MTGTVSLLRSHLATDRAAGAAVALVVAVAAFLAAAVPRATEHLATDGLRSAVDDAAPLDRDLRGVVGGQVPLDHAPGAEPTAPLRGLLQDVDDRMRAVLAARVGTGTASIRYRQLGVLAVTPVRPDEYDTGVIAATVLTDQADAAGDPGLGDRVRWVAGSAPGRGVLSPDPAGPDPVAPSQAAPPGEEVGSSALPVAVSSDTARVFGLAPGSVVELDHRLTATVSGVFEPVDPDDPYWSADSTLLHPSESYSSREGRIQSGSVVVPPDSAVLLAQQLYRSVVPQVGVRFPVASRGVESAQAPALVTQLRRFEGERFAVPSPVGGPAPDLFDPPALELKVASGLDLVVLEHLRQQRTSSAVVALVSAGLAGVLVAVLTLATRLVVERRRRALSLVVARGGSVRDVAVVQALEGVVLGTPAAVLAMVVAQLAVAGRPGLWGWVLPALVALAPAALLPVLGVVAVRDGPGGAARRDAVVRVSGRPGRRRLVLDALAVLLAVAATWTLRARGLAAEPTSAGSSDPAELLAGSDPLLVAAPLLVALASASLVARLIPAPLRWLARLTSRRTGAVTFLGAARAGREQVAGTLPVLVVVLATATCVVGVTISSSASEGVRTAAAQAVGADARTTSPGFAPEAFAAAAAVDGVADVVGVVDADADVSSPSRDGSVQLFAADVAALASVQRDVPGAADLGDLVAAAAGFSGNGVNGGQAPGDRVPVLVSPDVAPVGTEIRVAVGRGVVDAVVVGSAPRLLPVSGNRPWVLADTGSLDASTLRLPLAQVALIDLAPADADGKAAAAGRGTASPRSEVAERVAQALGTVAPVTSVDDAAAQIRSRPLVDGTLGSFGFSAVLAALLCALAVVLTLAAAVSERTRVLSRLRTVGLDVRQSGWLVAWEALPVVGPGLLVGVVVGLAVSLTVYPAVDLRAFTTGSDRPAVTVDPGLLGATLSGVVLACVMAVVVAVLTGSRAQLGSVLRAGEAA